MKSFNLPRFARDRLRDGGHVDVRCQRCHGHLFERDVTFVGATGGKGKFYFAYEVVCPQCKRINAVIDRTRQFSDPNWWEELGRWHDQALQEMGPFDRHPTHSHAIRLVVGPPPLETLFVYCGCKGEVGPVLLGYSGGVCRLERDSRIRKFDIHDHPSHLSANGWKRLHRTPEGQPFVADGKVWTRLTRAEMQDIVCDRVFTVIHRSGTRKAESKSTKQSRGPYEKPQRADPQKSRRPRRCSSRDSRSVDS